MSLFNRFFITLMLLLTLNAEAVETDWLELKEGFVDKKTGAKLKKIQPAAEPDQQLITVAIPKNAIDADSTIEEVVVIGHKPKQKEFEIPISYEWAENFEEDYYGLIIKFGKENKFPIRIYFKGDNEKDVSP